MIDESSWAGIPIYTSKAQGQQQVQEDKPFEIRNENLRETKEWEGIPVYGQDEFHIGKKFEAFPNPRDSIGVLMEDENGQIFKSTGDTWEAQKFSPKNVEEQPGRTGLRVVGRENPKESLKRFPSPHTSKIPYTDISIGVKNPDVWAKSEQDLEKPEDTLWSGVRTGMQLAKAAPWAIPQARIPMAIGSFGAEALEKGAEYLGPNEGEIDELKSNFKKHGIQVDDATFREDVNKGVKQAQEWMPTLGKLYNWFEEKGVPLEAKTPLQKSISVGSDVAAMSDLKLATPAASLAMTMYNSLLNQQVPENIAGFISRAFGMVLGEKSPEMEGKDQLEPTSPGPRPEIGEEPRTEYERSQELVKYLKGGEPPGKNIKVFDPTKGKELKPGMIKQSEGKLPESAKERFYPKPPTLPKPSPGERQLQIELAKLEKPSTGKELKVTQEKKGFPISDIAKKQLKLEGLEIRSPGESITPKEKIGESISLLKSPGPSKTGKSAKQIVNENERSVINLANKKYENAEKLTDNVIITTEEMTPELESLVDEWKESSDPIEKDVAREARKLLDQTRGKIKKSGEGAEEELPEEAHMPVKVSFLIKRDKELKSGMKYRFENDPENKYGRLTEIINKQVYRAAEGNPEAIKAVLEANNFYKHNYAPLFKNKESIPFLDKNNIRYANLYETLKTPDGYNFFKPIFMSTPQGERLLRTIRRDIIEDSLKGFVEKEGKFNKNSVGQKRLIEQTLDELNIGITKEEKNNIFRAMTQMKTDAEQAQLLAGKEPYKPTKKETKVTKEEITKPLKPLKKRKLEVKSQKWFDTADAKDILKELDEVKKVKIYRQKSKVSVEREKEFDKIARDAGVAKIMKNKTPNEVTHKDIKEALRDVNTKEYLKETLGKETVAIFEKRISDIEKWEEDIAKYESQMKALEKQRTEAAETAKKSLLSRKMEIMAKIAKKELTMYALNQIPVLPHFLKQGITDATFDK
jgi:hypothetical protein